MDELGMNGFSTAIVTPERTNIKAARDEVMDVLATIDKNKLSLPDLKLYVDILKATSEVQVASFSEMWPIMRDTLALGFKSPTISDYKSE